MNKETTMTTKTQTATLNFYNCSSVAVVDWLGPVAEANEDDFDYIEGYEAVLHPGSEFEVDVDGVTTTCIVPSTTTDEETLQLLTEPSEDCSGQENILRYSSFEVVLNEGEKFNSDLIGWKKVILGNLELGLVPVSYDGDTDRLEFTESDIKGTEYSNWVDGNFVYLSSFEELVEVAG